MNADVNGMNTLLDIYSYYVEQTSIWLLIADGWEIHRLVAELNGKTVGYEQMGYRLVWKIEQCGFEFNRWFNTIIIDKIINEPIKEIKNIKKFVEVQRKFGFKKARHSALLFV